MVTGFTGAPVHQGSWFGLPDFGVTEAIGSLFHAPTTSQGGSNINYSSPQASLGATTYQAPTNTTPYGPINPGTTSAPQAPQQTTTRPSGGGGGGGGGAPVDPYAGVRNDISSAWDSYLNSLSGVGDYLGQQQTAQNGVADSQLHQGQDAVNAQRANSLKDIANTTRNAFQAGNNYLGSLGAGDSSAANQYAFAINQQAGKQTGDLNNFVTSKLKDLQYDHDQKIQSIASWFTQQQEALKQQLSTGQLNKSQDINSLSKNILDQALQATNQIKTNTQNQYNSLLQWAANNSSTMPQLQQNIAAIPQAMGQLQTYGANSNAPVFGGAPTSNQQTDIFGNPIYKTS